MNKLFSDMKILNKTKTKLKGIFIAVCCFFATFAAHAQSGDFRQLAYTLYHTLGFPVDEAGNIYVLGANYGGSAQVNKISPAGVVTANWVSVPTSSTAIFYNGGYIYVQVGVNFQKYNVAGTLLTTYTTGARAISLPTFDSNGNLWYISGDDGTGSGIEWMGRLTLGGTTTDNFSQIPYSGYINIYSLLADHSGNMYLNSYVSGVPNQTSATETIFKFTSTGTVSTFSQNVPFSQNFIESWAIDPSDHIYMTATQGSGATLGTNNNYIYKWPTTGGVPSTFASIDYTDPMDGSDRRQMFHQLSIDASGNVFTLSINGNVLKFDPSGTMTTYASSYTASTYSYALALANGFVYVFNGDGNVVTSNLQLATASCTAPTAATISGSNLTFCSASTATTLTATVTGGTGGVTYQWKVGGTNISGATSASYTVPVITTVGTTSYTVTVTGTGTCNSSVTSAARTITVTSPPSAPAISGADQSFCGTSTATTLNATYTGGSAGVTYQWKVGGANISGATSASYTVPATSTAGVYAYTVAITGATPCTSTTVTSTARTFTVNVTAAPAFTTTAPTCTVLTGSVNFTNLPTGAWSLTRSGTSTATIGGSGATYSDAGLAVGTYTYTVTNTTTGCVSTASATATITAATGCAILVSPKVFLQGAMSGTVMTTTIQANVPLSQPYNYSPFSYAGTETMASRPATLVDWVMVELKSAASPYTLIATRAALLLSNGSVTDVDGVSPVSFPGQAAGSYTIGIRHRNHLPVRTLAAVALSATTTTVDFTANANVYQNPAVTTNAAEVNTSGAIYAMWAGDANANGAVRYQGPSNDLAYILGTVLGSNPLGNLSGQYSPGDVNMNGVVRYQGPSNDPAFILSSVLGSNPLKIVSQHY